MENKLKFWKTPWKPIYLLPNLTKSLLQTWNPMLWAHNSQSISRQVLKSKVTHKSSKCKIIKWGLTVCHIGLLMYVQTEKSVAKSLLYVVDIRSLTCRLIRYIAEDNKRNAFRAVVNSGLSRVAGKLDSWLCLLTKLENNSSPASTEWWHEKCESVIGLYIRLGWTQTYFKYNSTSKCTRTVLFHIVPQVISK